MLRPRAGCCSVGSSARKGFAVATLLVSAALLSGLVLGACSKSGKAKDGSANGDKKPDERVETTVPVGIVQVVQGDIIATMAFSATVESERNIVVYSQTSGLAEEVLGEEGDRVSAGQVVLRLEDDDARIAYERAQVELRKLQSDSLRMAGLYSKGLESRDAYETVLYQVNRARLTLDEAVLGLRRTRIRAPVRGIISARNVEIGNRVDPASEVFRLVTMDSLIAHIFVPGRTRQHLVVGQQARIASDMLPGYEVEGVIKRINPVVDPQSGTVKVTVALQDRERKFTPGMFVNVALITDRRGEALLVPKEALTYDAGQAYAFVVKDSTAHRTVLELGLTNPRQVEVLAGLGRGDSVVIVGQEGLRDGAKVRVVEQSLRPVPKAEKAEERAPET